MKESLKGRPETADQKQAVEMHSLVTVRKGTFKRERAVLLPVEYREAGKGST